MNFQISKHELCPVFIGSSTSQVSESIGCNTSVLGCHFFWDTENMILYEKQIVTHVTKRDTHDAAF